jgi:glutamyl-tRNA synthetase
MTGRFAPSPTGVLHLGNLRTAVIAWLAARSTGDEFVVRMEDLDRVNSSREHERAQLADLAAVGIDWDGDVVRQSDRFDRYEAAIGELASAGLTYECFCTRREIREQIEAATAAPHGATPGYPGTCRRLAVTERRARRESGRPAALRLDAGAVEVRVVDRLAGELSGRADDVVLRRNDGVPAYNLAVVVDDAAQGITQVVRGDDLLASTPSQVRLQQLLGLPTPDYLHVPLVVDAAGERLAKRRGLAVTIDALTHAGVPVERIVAWIVDSLVPAVPAEPTGARGALAGALAGFDADELPRDPCPAPLFVVES